MRISAPRYLLIILAGLFAGYHILLGAFAIPGGYALDASPVVVSMVLYGIAMIAAFLPGPRRMPIWLAAFIFAVSITLPLLVSSQLDPYREGGNWYATWYVAAVGTMMTVVCARRRPGFAWAGILFLVIQTLIWGGPGALLGIGVIGSASWVGVAHIITNALTKAARDSRRFAVAERGAAEWQAAQEAHVNERQFRLGKTSVMALPMLRTIQASAGNLTEAQRAECLHLESAIRDEIRGRKLLNDAVREQVMLARRRGVTVTLLDEGGLDDLEEADLQRVLDELARALSATVADKVIARTVPEGSDIAVTVVGLRTTDDGSASLLGHDTLEYDEVELWLEIPRAVE
ncbi:MAG TPA: hypothetical protein VNT53_02675 [Pseudolysinimonas sp.]|nr:hypothetical protein [Pseudolysinimonas sp.]